ncbi:hypothetical protein OPT61_g6033 [Boeremia exigua]|uniref:Uncharacterized protein n=1 Tax=Boeremia exigua TaxID=749465 RepID=A0ACC2I844_9PLEO|nr:hypothetical protein OPT61_g6033 [Boeremia exigua]
MYQPDDNGVDETTGGTTRGTHMPFDRQETRLVIGIDYGTTFTGVAYATPSGGQCSLKQIDVMTDWGPQMDNHDKVPSVISYSRPSQKGEQQWGSSLSPDAVTMVHTKLELGIQNVAGELDMTLQLLDGVNNLDFNIDFMGKGSQDLPPYSHKNPEEIVTDYLRRVFQWLEQEVERFDAVLRKHIATDIVVTIPTEWSYTAINSTFRAMTNAGFNRINFPSLEDIMFITEPEAAALYTARHYRDEKAEEFLREGQCFILCDAGGGTVDVVSYRVKALHPVLKLDQIGVPTGQKCGSIFINQEFKRWMRGWLGDEHFRKLDPNLDVDRNATHAAETPAMRDLMKMFDAKKKNFTYTSESHDIRLTLPPPLQNLTIPHKVHQGLVIIPKEIMEDFFDACIKEIVQLIKRHINRIGRQGSRPKNLFLVGGFGESEYLQYQLKDTLLEEDWQMHFRRPNDSWTAVVQGAVVCGVEKASISNLRRTNACRYSYAVCLDEVFSRMHHSEQDVALLNGRNVAASQLIWMLKKGDLILSDQVCKREKEFDLRLGKLRQDSIKVEVYRNSSDDKERPTLFRNARDELETVCELKIDLSKLKFESNRPSVIRRVSQKQVTDNFAALLQYVYLDSSPCLAVSTAQHPLAGRHRLLYSLPAHQFNSWFFAFTGIHTWYFTSTSVSDYYRLHTLSKGDQNALDVDNYYGRNSIDMHFYYVQERSGQFWQLSEQSDGSVKLSNNFTGPDIFLDIDEASLKPTLRAGDGFGTHWTLSSPESVPTEAPSQTITNTSATTSSPVSSTEPSSTGPSSPDTSETSAANPSKMSTGTIAGIAVGSVAAVGVLVGAFVYWWFKKSRKGSSGAVASGPGPMHSRPILNA